MTLEAGDVGEVYVEDAPAEPIAMVAGAWYLVRDFGEAIGPFDAAGEGSEVEAFRATMGGRVVVLDATPEGLRQLHVYQWRNIVLPQSIINGLFDTVIRFGHRSLEHNIAQQAANNYKISQLSIRIALKKEDAVCVTRRRETWGEEDRARRAAAAEEERSKSQSAPSASEDDPVPASQPAIEKTSLPQRGESASRPRSGSSTRLPASWHRKTETPSRDLSTTMSLPELSTPAPTPEKTLMPMTQESSKERPLSPAIHSQECATIQGEPNATGASSAAARVPAQGSLFLAHEIAPLLKPAAVKAKRGGKKTARA